MCLYAIILAFYQIIFVNQFSVGKVALPLFGRQQIPHGGQQSDWCHGNDAICLHPLHGAHHSLFARKCAALHEAHLQTPVAIDGIVACPGKD